MSSSNASHARLRVALKAIELQCNDATVDFIASCVHAESTVDDFVDVLGPFLQESTNASPTSLREKATKALAIFNHSSGQQRGNGSPAAKNDGGRGGAVSSCPPVEGLETWLKELRLEGYIPKAIQWCQNMGAAELKEIYDNVEDFCEALHLKELEKKRVRENCSSKRNNQRYGMPKEFWRDNHTGADDMQAGGGPAKMDVTVQRTVTPQNEGNRVYHFSA